MGHVHAVRRQDTRPRWSLLAVSLVVVAVVAAIGGMATSSAVDSWYEAVEKPSWNPPNAVFGPVWTVLYVAMAVAAWLVAREGLDLHAVRIALATYSAQLALNLAWTVVFFGLESRVGGLVVIAALLLAIAVTIVRFWPISRVATWLLVPYLAWVAFASSLNLAIVVLN